ncbi:unnamed protein product [Nippostrongylus brasiliensis]|uniref:Endo/exonuclease/phosphatase domain-containing protein n=1 Tax=Nippostrongylus brasiliensis TaxID=27835 RepID=A0A0N4XZZ9_NIPBR|nr:unnamed protein product [Nippostrongylus brasiliensis]
MRGSSMQEGWHRGVTKLVRKCQSDVVSKQEGQHRGSSKQALKCQSSMKTRVATLNVGTLTGRSSELAAALVVGSPKDHEGVGVAVSERFRDSIAEVKPFNDRLMKVAVVTEERRLHFFTAYAPQTGCSEEVQDVFWALLHEKTAEIPSEEMAVVAGDLNGHVGISKDGFKCHGGFGYGIRNEDGERILKYTCSHNLAIANTMFRKRPSHLISFYSGNTRSQIDYVLVRRRDAKLVSNAKVVPYETVASQHRPLICTMKIAPSKRERLERADIPASSGGE